MPEISVIMAVYNGEDTLRQSIASLLAQSFTDFELILIDDGSKDESLAIMKEYAARDERIKIHVRANDGLTKSLNYGLSVAKGKYIARQDADDFSLPSRFDKQFKFLEQHPHIHLLGGNSEDIYPDGHVQLWGYHEPDDLQKITFFKTPFPHSTVMMRADVAKRLGGYDNSFRTSQDMEFWMRFAKDALIGMLPDPLIRRSVVLSSISYKRRWRQFYDAFRARWRHNPPEKRIVAVYHSLRGLTIHLLPHGFIRQIKSYIRST